MARPPSKPDSTGAPLTKGGKIDPDNLDVADSAKVKARNRPAPRSELVDGADRMVKRAEARKLHPSAILEPAGFDEEHWTSPHNDVGLWSLQLGEAFGTRSQAVITTFMRQLEKLCEGVTSWDEAAQQWRMDEFQFSTVLAMVNTVKPENEMEAALAAQMVAIHLMQMRTSARALRYDHDTQTAAVAAKLARTFNDQVRLLREVKGKRRSTRQTIKVTKETHQHVHYHDDRGGRNNAGQPDAPIHGTCAAAELSALPSPDEGGQVVPITSRTRQSGLSNARSKGRGSQGEG